MAAQGWKPGNYLGAENASHAEHYTAANASHIRVLLREDNLGLGAKVGGKGNAETFGLSTLSGIFGRLNGKTDAEVEKQQSNLRDAELRTYQAQKYGFMNFVRGGLLVGDKIEEVQEKLVGATRSDPRSTGVPAAESKKRKAEEAVSEEVEEKQARRKKRKSDLRAQAEANDEAAEATLHEDALVASRPSTDMTEDVKAAKRRRKEEKRAAKRATDSSAASEDAIARAEKRAGKEERRKRKEEKRRRKAAAVDEDGGDASESASVTTSAVATPSATSGASTPTSASLAFGGGSRHAVRQRYIMQKRMASMDVKALNEILMVKAQG